MRFTTSALIQRPATDINSLLFSNNSWGTTTVQLYNLEAWSTDDDDDDGFTFTIKSIETLQRTRGNKLVFFNF